MIHRKKGKKFTRTAAHRRAFVRNFIAGLIRHGQIVTTVQKAKYCRPFAERLVTLAKVKTLHRYRRALQILHDEDAVHILFAAIGPHFGDRPGGYTRIIKLPRRRVGDDAQPAILAFVDYTPAKVEAPVPLKSKAAPPGKGGAMAGKRREKVAAAGAAGA